MQQFCFVAAFAVGVCLAAPHGYRESPEPKHDQQIRSSASLRRSLQDPEHPGIDLWNVVFDTRSKQVRVHQPDQVATEAIRRIGSRLTNRMIGTSGGIAEMTVNIVNDRPLDIKADCDVRLPAAAYFIRPWFWDNACFARMLRRRSSCTTTRGAK